MSRDFPSSVVALLQEMVRLNTVNAVASGNLLAEQPLAIYNQQVAEAMGFATRRLPIEGRGWNLLVTHKVGSDRPWIMFDSHMDTVSTEGMSIDPWGASLKDGRMWGRGSCDTKGTGAAMLWALHQYAQSKDQPNNVAILFTIDEESGMTGVRRFVSDHYPALGFKVAGVIVGEPTLLRPMIAHNGAVRWRITATGRAAHSSNPTRGRSAISPICAAVLAIEQQYVPTITAGDPLTGKAQCSINIIRGGQQVNMIPDHCEIHVDRRLVPGERTTDVLPAIEPLLREVTRAYPDVTLQQEVLTDYPALPRQHAEPLLPAVQQVLTAHSLPTDAIGGPFGTNASTLACGGIPALVLGPGDVAQAHTKDEWVDLEQIEKGVAVYAGLMAAAWK